MTTEPGSVALVFKQSPYFSPYFGLFELPGSSLGCGTRTEDHCQRGGQSARGALALGRQVVSEREAVSRDREPVAEVTQLLSQVHAGAGTRGEG